MASTLVDPSTCSSTPRLAVYLQPRAAALALEGGAHWVVVRFDQLVAPRHCAASEWIHLQPLLSAPHEAAAELRATPPGNCGVEAPFADCDPVPGMKQSAEGSDAEATGVHPKP